MGVKCIKEKETMDGEAKVWGGSGKRGERKRRRRSRMIFKCQARPKSLHLMSRGIKVSKR